TGKQYYSYGIGARTYGTIWPDRTVQPEIYQVKKSTRKPSGRAAKRRTPARSLMQTAVNRQAAAAAGIWLQELMRMQVQFQRRRSRP
ncbi:MAG: hypothetical protein II627_01295, partial [Lachnospiraceae bacterium]|nr:hypothetical protein [Lachnospiraceae bacterium]